MQFNFEQLRDLLVAIDQTSIGELTLKTGDLEITLRRDVAGHLAVSSPPAVSGPSGVEGATAPPSPVIPEPRPTVPLPTVPVTAGSPSPLERKWTEVLSPIVGTFYRSPAPDEAPFVEVGDRIRNGQTVCIIEAMKIMNEIDAEVSGEVMEILVHNGQPVEFNQVLMRVNPG